MLDLLITATILCIVLTYSLTEFVRVHAMAMRHMATQELSSYLQRARSDSIRRHATDPQQMARIAILNKRSYSVAFDANGDGVMDSPVIINLAQGVTLGDPVPRTFMFDSHGRTVDPELGIVQAAPVTVSNKSGTSLINVSDIARPAATSSLGMSSSKK